MEQKEFFPDGTPIDEWFYDVQIPTLASLGRQYPLTEYGICDDGAVCTENGRVMAYGGVLWAPYEGQITNIATHPDARRCGMGAVVLEYLIEVARSRECEMLSLEARVSNIPAISLYERYGFLKMGVRRGFYKHPTEDAYVMCLQLDGTKK